jgi:pyridoxine 5-phosphate synthase
MPELCVNIDHVATVRQARRTYEPDPVLAATEAEAGGADGITVHLREDRRHIQDSDLPRLKEVVRTKLNLEMAATDEMVAIAIALKPELSMFVPERRAEVTTEGGLDVAGQFDALKPTVARLQSAGIRVSMFIEPARAQIEASHRLGAEIVELHTGAFANATGEAQRTELVRIHQASVFAHGLGVQVNAGHGINYTNIALIRTVPHLAELNIGHSIVARAVFSGLDAAVREMLAAMKI